MIVTWSILLALKLAGRIKITSPSLQLVKHLLPFSCIYALDLNLGLAGTGAISLPLFSALRRLSNLFILYGEILFFKKSHHTLTHISLFTMVGGAFVAVA